MSLKLSENKFLSVVAFLTIVSVSIAALGFPAMGGGQDVEIGGEIVEEEHDLCHYECEDIFNSCLEENAPNLTQCQKDAELNYRACRQAAGAIEDIDERRKAKLKCFQDKSKADNDCLDMFGDEEDAKWECYDENDECRADCG